MQFPKLWAKGWFQWTLVVLVIVGASFYSQRDMLTSGTQISSEKLPVLSAPRTRVEPVFEPGQRTLVYFFAPWCVFCDFSFDNLSYVEDKLQVVAVAQDYQSAAEVETFIQAHETKVKVLLGTERTKQMWQVSGYPSYYIVDENGKIEHRSRGYSSALGLRLRAEL